jgi:hypothetical protein
LTTAWRRFRRSKVIIELRRIEPATDDEDTTMKELSAFHLAQTRAQAIELRRRGLFDEALEESTRAWQIWCRKEAAA